MFPIFFNQQSINSLFKSFIWFVLKVNMCIWLFVIFKYVTAHIILILKLWYIYEWHRHLNAISFKAWQEFFVMARLCYVSLREDFKMWSVMLQLHKGNKISEPTVNLRHQSNIFIARMLKSSDYFTIQCKPIKHKFSIRLNNSFWISLNIILFNDKGPLEFI